MLPPVAGLSPGKAPEAGQALAPAEALEVELRENEDCLARIRQVQDRLAVVAQKKKTFRRQVAELDARVAQLEARCVQYQRELKLLQKGLTRKGGHEPFRDRVDDLAELMDLLGR